MLTNSQNALGAGSDHSFAEEKVLSSKVVGKDLIRLVFFKEMKW